MQNRQLAHRGMTLVELLVVVAIIGILLAISVPMLKPMLESRRTSNAAQVLAGAFKHARTKAIQEGRSYGIRLSPYKTAPTAAVQLWLVKDNAAEYAVNDPLTRVVVEHGRIIPYRFDVTTGEWQASPIGSAEYRKVEQHFRSGSTVQFNHVGSFFPIGGGLVLQDHNNIVSYASLCLPDEPVNPYGIPMKYSVSAKPSLSSTWLPPAVMPRGMIVDLAFCGGETVDFDGNAKTSVKDISAHFLAGDEVTVMFSPTGYVDKLYVDNIYTKSQREFKVNEILYFCVGDWDRQIDAESGTTLAEDNKSNLEVPATYWVVLHPKTGGVRITENAPVKSSDPMDKKLGDARKYAREHFFNVGN
jgi:prepilin-type N-terminal cleavage/methylation domain-containing protein